MKLFSRICQFDTLHRAWRRVQKRGRTPGVDGVTLAHFGQNVERRLVRLSQQISSGSYRPRPLRRCEIPKKGKSESRVLAIPAVRDRVAQTAALLVLQPVIEPVLQPCSFGYRPGRSHRDALRAVCQLRDGGCCYVVEADIRAFFESIHHERCLELVRKLAPEPALHTLVRHWVAAIVLGHKGQRKPISGLPQGAVISPLLSNLYLNAFDRSMLEGGHQLVRFADDFVVPCRSEALAREALHVAKDHLEICGLTLHPAKTSITTFVRGFKFLGACFQGAHMRTPDHSSKSTRSATTEITPSLVGAASSASTSKHTPGREKKQIDRGKARQDSGAQAFMRTLYLHRQGSMLRVKGGRFVVTSPDCDKPLLSLPIRKIEQIVVFGTCHLTAGARRCCLTSGIPVTLLSSIGRYYGRLESTLSRDVTLERLQFLKTTDEAFSLNLGRRLVRGKLRNTHALLRRRLRVPGLPERHRSSLSKTERRLRRAIRRAESATSLASLRGIEGAGAAAYFGVFNCLLDPKAPAFPGRVRRPPTDPVNALLSFGYTLLFNNIYSIVRLRRLNPYAGFLHTTSSGHPALVSDLIEEFRCLIEAHVLHLLNRRTFRAGDFRRSEKTGGCLLTTEARKRFIYSFEQLLRRRFTHPTSRRVLTYRQGLDHQVRLLARHLEGQVSYVPFRWR